VITSYKKSKLLFCLGVFSVLSVFSTSCGFNPKKYFSKKINLAGAVTHEPSAFTPLETGTFRLSSDEVVHRRDHRGGKTSFLWGLITYTDY